MSILFKNMRDKAYTQNNFLHYMFGFGTIFARSSAGAMNDMEVPNVPDVAKVYRVMDVMYQMTDEERKKLRSLDELEPKVQDFELEESIE